MSERIGLIGIGLVGAALAQRLRAASYDVIGYDLDPSRCDVLRELGGDVAGSGAEVGRAVDRLLLSLPDTDAVMQAVEAPGGVLDTSSPPTVILDTTTGDPDETADLARRLQRRDVYFLEATISGSSRQVAEGAAVFMVGGDHSVFEPCRDLLDALGKHVFYVGPSGSGSRAKLASNLIVGLNRLVLAEGLVFADRLGLDTMSFLELLKATPAYSVAMDVKGNKMLSGDFTPQSRIRQHHKDVQLILEYAGRAGQELPLSQVHRDVLEKAMAAGEGDLDNAAVIREIGRRRTGSRHGQDPPAE